MSGYCALIPTIKVGEKEIESKLFKNLSNTFKDRETVKTLWAFTQTDFFKKSFSDIQTDENGEPLLSELEKKLDLSKFFENKMTSSSINKVSGAVNSKGETMQYNSIKEATDKVNDFNKKHPEYVSNVVVNYDKFNIHTEKKNNDNAINVTKEKFNSSLNNKLYNIVRSLGFDVEKVDNPTYVGVFNPIDARDTEGKIRTIIKIANNQAGEDAFPEEFAHFAIAGLQDNPLVQRLLKTLEDDEVIKRVLNGKYDMYDDYYNHNKERIKLEAAGKLLSQALKGEITTDITERKSLLERIFQQIKRLFAKLTGQDIDNAVLDANREASELASAVLTDKIGNEEYNVSKILDSHTLYELKEEEKEANILQKNAQKALELYAKQVEILQQKTKSPIVNKDIWKKLKNLNDRIAEKNYASGCLYFINNCFTEIEQLKNEIKEAEKNSKGLTGIANINQVCNSLKKLKEISDCYLPIINDLKYVKELADEGIVNIAEADALEIAELSNKVSNTIERLNKNYKDLRYDTVYQFLKMWWGEDKILQITKDKTQALTLESLLKQATKDITFADSLVNSMSDCSDPILSLVDKIVKTQQEKRDKRLRMIDENLRAIHTKFNGDTSFMYERDKNGKLTGRLISDRDYIAYNEAYKQTKDKIFKDKSLNYLQKQKRLRQWEEANTDELIIDEDMDRTERVPKKSIYPSNALDRLTPAQREYYNSMIEFKKSIDSLLPAIYTQTHKAVQMRNDNLQILMDNATSPKKALSLYLNNIKDEFTRTVDDTEFGETHGLQVHLGIDGNPIKKIPIYYTTELEDMDRLNTDFTSTITAYAAMAVNYNEMSEVIAGLELTKELIKEREVTQNSGDKAINETFKVLGKIFRREYTTPGNENKIGKRIDDYFDSVLYGQMKKSGDVWKIGKQEINSAKALDALKQYSGVVGLGINAFSAIANVSMGKIQLWIESVAGSVGEKVGNNNTYFTLKDYIWSKVIYNKELPNLLSEINSTKKTSKMALMVDKFDALEEFYSNLKRSGYYQGPLSRFVGNSTLFILQNLGEHVLHVRTMLSMMHRQKVKVNGVTMSLWDAYDVVTYIDPSTGGEVSTLKLKDGATWEDGSTITDEDLTKLKHKIGKVNQSMNGAFNETDKGAIHRYALGRLVMQFRQWMPAHYARRFASARYDAELEEYREGYYRTMWHFTTALMSDIVKFKFQVGTHWNELTTYQKTNIVRGATEITIYAMLGMVINMMGPVDKDKGYWGRTVDKMLRYQLKRMRLEVGASVPSFEFLSNAKTIVQSPVAAIKPLDNLLNVFKWWNIGVEIEKGKWKGYSVYEKDFLQVLPVYSHYKRTKDLADWDYMFQIFNNVN